METKAQPVSKMREVLPYMLPGDKNDYVQKVPKLLPAAAFVRKNGVMVMAEYNGIVMIQVNNLSGPMEADEVKKWVKELPQTYLAFVGSSGKSVKIWVRFTYPDDLLPVTLVLRIHRNACHLPFVHRMKIEIKGIPLPTFHLCSQLVETKLIAAFHKFIHLHNKYLFGKQTAFIGKPTSGTIDILHRLPNQRIIFRQVIMSARPPYRILFGNTCTETMSRKGNQQRMYISVWLKCPLFLQRPL